MTAAGAALDVGTPVRLFEHALIHSERERNRWAASADGQRFLLNAPSGDIEPPRIQVVLDWRPRPAGK